MRLSESVFVCLLVSSLFALSLRQSSLPTTLQPLRTWVETRSGPLLPGGRVSDLCSPGHSPSRLAPHAHSRTAQPTQSPNDRESVRRRSSASQLYGRQRVTARQNATNVSRRERTHSSGSQWKHFPLLCCRAHAIVRTYPGS